MPTTTQTRRGSAQVNRIIPRSDDPPAEAGVVLVYARDVEGVSRIVARFSNGNINIIL